MSNPSSDDERLSADEIQRLLDAKRGPAKPKPAAEAPAAPPPAPPAFDSPAAPPPARPEPSTGGSSIQESVDKQIEQLLNSAERGVKQAATASATGQEARPFQLDAFSPAAETTPISNTPLDLLGDVELDLRIELGRTQMRLEEVLQLRGGAIVALDKLAGDPVDVYVNGRMIARGEILVLNENFCVRVTELIAG